MAIKYYTTSITGKTQANGAQEIDVMEAKDSQFQSQRKWQIQIVPSATPTTGTMTVSVKSPDATAYADLPTTIDMTGTELLVIFEAAADAIKLTPASFDADKTYSAYLTVM